MKNPPCLVWLPMDHRLLGDEERPMPFLVVGDKYARAVKVEAQAQPVQVNSLHGQGIARLAPGLRALAHASDGLVEAFAVEGAGAFAYAVQWHPEWRCQETPFYAAIFKAFGQACRARQSARQGIT